jgi:uncharacterized damage-inducible protein DinB
MQSKTMLISELMIPELAAEAAMTRRLLARVPADKLNWKPPADLHTIGWNASHLVEIVGWVPGIVALSEFDIAPVGGEAAVTAEATDVTKLLAKFDESLAQALASLQGAPDAVMAEPWSLKFGGHTIFTMPKGDCLRKWVFTHTAHHRGILSVYLRMAGQPAPSLYEE